MSGVSRSFCIPGGKTSAATPYLHLAARHRGGELCRVPPPNREGFLFMRFAFIDAADLHIDSPFAGFGLKELIVAERFAMPGTAQWRR
jgi:hypothetical protein